MIIEVNKMPKQETLNNFFSPSSKEPDTKIGIRISFGLELEFDNLESPGRQDFIVPSSLFNKGWGEQGDYTAGEELRSPKYIIPATRYNLRKNLLEIRENIKEGLREWIKQNQVTPWFSSKTEAFHSLGTHTHIGNPSGRLYKHNTDWIGCAIYHVFPLIVSLSANNTLGNLKFLSSRQRSSNYCFLPHWWSQGEHYAALSHSHHGTLEIRIPDSAPPAIAFPNAVLLATLAKVSFLYGLPQWITNFSKVDREVQEFYSRPTEYMSREKRKELVTKLLELLYPHGIWFESALMLALFLKGLPPQVVIRKLFQQDRKKTMKMGIVNSFTTIFNKYLEIANMPENRKREYKELVRTIVNNRYFISIKKASKILGVQPNLKVPKIALRRVIWGNQEEVSILEELMERRRSELINMPERIYLILKNSRIYGYIIVLRDGSEFEFKGAAVHESLTDEDKEQLLKLARLVYSRRLSETIATIAEE